MLIDFHTHMFPDAIADRAVASLHKNILRMNFPECVDVHPHGTATEAGLLKKMKHDGVDLSVVMPIATKVEQTDSIIAFAEGVNRRYAARIEALRCAWLSGETLPTGEPFLLSFASMHPDEVRIDERLQEIKSKGFLGIKMHPMYQNFHIDDDRAVYIFKKAHELGLIVLLHSGADIGMPVTMTNCTPARYKPILAETKGRRMVAAHLGAFAYWGDVEQKLVGYPLYFDTAMLGDEPFISNEQYLRIIRAHESKYILFGSDYPWSSAAAVRRRLLALGDGRLKNEALRPLTSEERDNIFYKNALRLLFGEPHTKK